MNKLLFFASDYNIGLSSLLTEQLIALYKSGVNVVGIAGEQEQEQGLREKLKKQNISLHTIVGLDKHSNVRSHIRSICNVMLKNDIKVVHVQNNWQLAIVSLARIRLRKKVKVIYTLHGFRNNNKLKSRIAQLLIGLELLLFADRVICMCTFLKNKFRLLSFKIVLLPLGIPDNFFPNEYPSLPNTGLQMIFPAQFRHGKNQNLVIEAFAEHIRKTGDSVSHLTLPGTGPLLDETKQLASKLNISNRVSFPGQCSKDEILKMYLKCNIGVISSNSETFGQSIVEPFVLGRCIISTHVGIAIDIIKNMQNGFIFSDVNSLSSIFKKLFHNPELIIQAGTANYNQRNMFKWDRISQLYKETFWL